MLVTTDFQFVNKFMDVHIYDWQRLFLQFFGYEIVCCSAAKYLVLGRYSRHCCLIVQFVSEGGSSKKVGFPQKKVDFQNEKVGFQKNRWVSILPIN